MRKKIFAANWKMHLGPKEAADFCTEFLKITAPDPHREWVIFPPAISLTTLQKSSNATFIKFGGQNCYFENKGAFTGEISAAMLKEVGSTYCLVGHSERRQLLGDTDQICAKEALKFCWKPV